MLAVSGLPPRLLDAGEWHSRDMIAVRAREQAGYRSELVVQGVGVPAVRADDDVALTVDPH